MARPRMTSSALVMGAPRMSVHRAISRDRRRERTSHRSACASGPLICRSAAPSGPAVERVDPVHAAADADHLAAEMLDQHAVVRLGVPEDQDPGAGGDGSGELPFDQGGFAGARLAEDELAGVGDQPGAQPGQRVQAHHLAEELMPSDRGADGRGAGAGGEREQPADLGGGGLVLRCRGDVRGAAGAGDLPSPRRRDRRLARLGGRRRGLPAASRRAGPGARAGRTGRGAAMS